MISTYHGYKKCGNKIGKKEERYSISFSDYNQNTVLDNVKDQLFHPYILQE
jgi:hypothetical protein